jgi:hypothetical protein
MPDELTGRLTNFVQYWDYIERRLKEVENLRGETFIPALNEMRYAGRHFIEAWSVYAKTDHSNFSKHEIEKLLIIAEDHLLRARYDITDGSCSFMHDKLAAMRDAYGPLRLARYYPHFVSFSRKLEEANQIIAQSRETRDQRGEQYQLIETEYLPELSAVYNDLRYAEHDLLKDKMEEGQRAQREAQAQRDHERHRRFVVATTIFLIVAAVISLPPIWEFFLRDKIGMISPGGAPKAESRPATNSEPPTSQPK